MTYTLSERRKKKERERAGLKDIYPSRLVMGSDLSIQFSTKKKSFDSLPKLTIQGWALALEWIEK